MHPLIEEIYSNEYVCDVDGNKKDIFPAALQYHEGKVLYDVIRENNAKNTLEIGMAYGLSTLFMCQALRENGEGGHVSIDPFQDQWFDGIGCLNVKKAEFNDIFRFFGEPSYIALAKLVEAGERFDFIFIDGNHRFDYTLVDFFLADKLLNAGGRMMLHDTWMPSVRKVMSYILRNRDDAYEIDARFTGKPNSRFKTMNKFVRSMIRNPREPAVASLTARWDFPNYFMLKKTKYLDEVGFGQLWDQHTSF